MTQEQKAFIERVGALAAADMQKSGVLASLTIAQAILESGWGKSGLTVKANALFGIKAGTSWKGRVYSTKTQECYDGVNFTTVTALFRAYDSWEESVADHSALLTGAARYKAVVGERDYKTACRAIKAAGYATDPKYPDKLIQIIESYGLTAYDGAGQAGAGGAGTAQKPSGTSDTSGALAFAVGDVVQFTGNTHYTSAAAASGKACKPGPAKVTMISKGAKHPYHLIKQAGGGSTVYGWVNAADVQSETDAAIDKLAGLGVINSPDYWKNAVAGGKVAYLDILFTQAAAKITKAGPRTADVKSGVGALVKAGVINTPEYWLQNYGKLQSLDLLLCALGGAV